MPETSIHRRIISGDAGAWAALLRAALSVGEIGYAAGVALRNRYYDRDGAAQHVAVPVISVGNITAGGTGKTPLVIDIVQRLERMGRCPAVVSRGYGSDNEGLNDEARLVRRHCPTAACVSDPDRVVGARRAIGRFGADVIVLDDAFQHRRLARDLDIVVIDALCPLGYGRMLPRGLLREPARNLRRAQSVVVSRCDQVSRAELERVKQRINTLAPDAALMLCRHEVTRLERLDGSEWRESLAGRRVGVVAGIGHPQAFLTTVRALGAEVVGTRWRGDHHRYSEHEAATLGRGFPQHDVIVVTEKDAVKLAELPGADAARVVVVRVAIAYEADGDKMMDALLAGAIATAQVVPLPVAGF